MSTLEIAGQRADVLSALRGLGGRATAGDVVAATGLGSDDARAALKALLETHRGHLEVSDTGELLYSFDPRLIERGTEPLLHRLARGTTRLLQRAFKAWIVLMLVVYFVLFVVLLVAALVAGQRGGRGRGRGSWGGGRGGHFRVPSFWFWYWIWGPRWRIGRPYYGHRWERTLERDDKVPFYKKVFAFVFGPDRPQPSQRQRDRLFLRLVRARGGVLTTSELVEHNALRLPEAEEEMARLLGAYGGEPTVSPDGEVVYVFPDLMMSAHGPVRAREPDPAWLRLEYPRELTGNTTGANALVAGINGFNLLAAATAPLFIFPRLGLGGTAAMIGLVYVPVVFSLLFFAVPLLRMARVKRENRRRERRNLRRVVLGLTYRDALGPVRGVTVDEALEHAVRRLPDRRIHRGDVEATLHALASELDADVVPSDHGPRFRFPGLRRQFAAAERTRRSLLLQERTPGAIVFSTADSAAEASARDKEAFDRELAGEDLNLGRYVPAVDRIGFEADYEVVAGDIPPA